MKTSNILLVSLLSLVLLAITAMAFHLDSFISEESIEGNKRVIEENRNTGPYTTVEARGKIKVFLYTDSLPSIVVKADSNLIRHIETSVEDQKLRVEITTRYRSSFTPEIHIRGPIPEKVMSTAGAMTWLKEPVNSQEIEINANAGGHVYADGQFGKMVVDINAGGHANISGTAKILDINANAGAHANLEQLDAREVTAKSNAGARIRLGVCQSAEFQAHAGASVEYQGTPVIKKLDISSGGNVKQKE
jgi:hypothetical protein